MGMRIKNLRTVGHRHIYTRKWFPLQGELAPLLEKWFPLQGERVQSLKLYNVHMLVFKNNIEMRNKVITSLVPRSLYACGARFQGEIRAWYQLSYACARFSQKSVK